MGKQNSNRDTPPVPCGLVRLEARLPSSLRWPKQHKDFLVQVCLCWHILACCLEGWRQILWLSKQALTQTFSFQCWSLAGEFSRYALCSDSTRKNKGKKKIPAPTRRVGIMTLCMSVICIFNDWKALWNIWMRHTQTGMVNCCWNLLGNHAVLCSQGSAAAQPRPSSPNMGARLQKSIIQSLTAANRLESLHGEQLRDGRCQADLGICSGAFQQGGKVWIGLSKPDTSPNHQKMNKSQLCYLICTGFCNVPESHFGPCWLFCIFFFFVQLQMFAIILYRTV